jgi:hypothetical protein
MHTVALVSDAEVIGGVTLDYGIFWYKIDTLWADSPVAAVTLLYSILEHYKHILPSSNISPAARAVVKRFYNKYKGTEVVVENITASEEGAVAAGYVWSPKLRKVPVQVAKPKNEEEINKLKGSVLKGFHETYSDPSRTKIVQSDPDVLFNSRYILELQELLKSWINSGDDKRDNALQWIRDNRSDLSQINNIYTRNILRYYRDSVDY